MAAVEYTEPQRRVIESPLVGRVFLHGPAGSGKTTAAVGRLRHLLLSGVPGESILVIVPQRMLASPFLELLRSPGLPPGGEVTVLTVGGLARRMVELFWPMAVGPAGFGHPDRSPVFLTLETSQYYLSRLLAPLLDQGYFEGITIDQHRLFSQILDNLNKSALVGFPHMEIGSRLKSAWSGDQTMLRSYDQAQECATLFRRFCLEHNLLDFSLQVEVFRTHIWQLPICRQMIVDRFRTLVVDNLEEDTPATHDLLHEWLPSTQGALLVFDEDAGYRRFLGADPESGRRLAASCEISIHCDQPHATTAALSAFARTLTGLEPNSEKHGGVTYRSSRFYPEMIDWVADSIQELIVSREVAPGEVAVLAPYMSDSLRFSIARRLEIRGVKTFTHRPSRSLRDEPACVCLLTLACLAHRGWELWPTKQAVAQAFTLAIEDMDLVRARLLAEILYRPSSGLNPFEKLGQDAQGRITFALGQRYERLRSWLVDYSTGEASELDLFMGSLFGEVLSQPGFGFHKSYELGSVAANLIESYRKFREALLDDESGGLSQRYITLVREGVLAAQYLRSWEVQPVDAVLLAPAFTFLLGNRPVEYQFWLSVGSTGWWDRPYQPLTQPYVLSRQWGAGRRWTDKDEMLSRAQVLDSLVQGLIRRCKKGIYLALSELGEHGTEERGPLLELLQRSLLQAGR